MLGWSQALALYLVGNTEKLPKEATYLGKWGWMDIDELLRSARLMTQEGGTSTLIAFIPDTTTSNRISIHIHFCALATMKWTRIAMDAV